MQFIRMATVSVVRQRGGLARGCGNERRRAVGLLAALALLAAGCGGAGGSGGQTDDPAGAAVSYEPGPAPADTTTSTPADTTTTTPADTTTTTTSAPADTTTTTTTAPVDTTTTTTTSTEQAGAGPAAGHVVRGSPDAATVVLYSQGGPTPQLETVDELEWMFAPLDLDQVLLINVHQAQTLTPSDFVEDDITFDEAVAAGSRSTAILAETVRQYLEQDRSVYVVGISFGAFVVQNLLATQGNVADGYLIMVGRLDIPEHMWKLFSQGRFIPYIDSDETVPTDEELDIPDIPPVRNMARIAAGLGHKRYTELLAGTDLGNVVYAYGETDGAVGPLTGDELAFLADHGARVVSIPGGHDPDFLMAPGIEALLGPGFLSDASP